MKKSIFQNSSIFLTFVLCWISIVVNSQNLKSTKITRKETSKVERFTDYRDLGVSLERKRFMIGLENQLKAGGNKTGLSPALNYIKVDSLICVWQSESEDINSSYHKLVSKLEGKINNWRLIKEDRNFRYFIQFLMVTDYGRYQVSITINSDKSASGYLSSPITNFSFYGRISLL